jgi:thiamine pyrophosphokinase
MTPFKPCRNCPGPAVIPAEAGIQTDALSLDPGLRIVTGPYGSEMPLPKSFGKRPGVTWVVTPCLIILNGEIKDKKIVLEAARLCQSKGGAILCVDGGLRHAGDLNLAPNFVIGDMDSLPKPIPKFKSNRPIFWCDFDESRSDFEKALDWAVRRGFKTVYVAGALGGGLDHSLVNLAMIDRLSSKISIVLLDQGRGFFLGVGRRRIAFRKGERFSLLAAPEAQVSLSGSRYALRKEWLISPSHGLGNVAMGAVDLRVHKGRVWFITVP